MKRTLAILLCALLALGAFSVSLAEDTQEIRHYSLMASVSADQGNWDDYWFFEYVEANLGIHFDITQVSDASFEEKKNLALATNALPDLFTGGLTDIDIATYGSQGIFVPLEDYITEENTPVIKAWFDVIDGYESALYYPDGHIYNMQGFMIIPREMATQRYWINNAWAQTAIGKLPETIDEYYEYLKYVRDNDMDGDGDATNEIPLGGRFTSVGSNASYFDAFKPTLFAFGLTERTLEAVDGKVQYNPVTDNFKEFVKFMRKLYAEGLLDSEYFTQTDDQYTAKLALGTVGAFNDWACWLRGEENWEDYTSNIPMTSDINDVRMWGARDLSLQRQFVITNHCADPGDLIRVADFTMTDDYDGPDHYLTEDRIALLGEHIDTLILDESGRLSQWRGARLGTWDKHPEWGWFWNEFTDDFGTYWAVDVEYPKDEYATQNAFWDAVMTPNCFPIPNQRLERQATAKENELTEHVHEYNEPYYHVGWSDNIKLTGEEADEVTFVLTDIEAYVDQMYGKFVTGDADIDAEWDNYVAGVKSRGLDTYLEIYQAAYDRWANAGE